MTHMAVHMGHYFRVLGHGRPSVPLHLHRHLQNHVACRLEQYGFSLYLQGQQGLSGASPATQLPAMQGAAPPRFSRFHSPRAFLVSYLPTTRPQEAFVLPQALLRPSRCHISPLRRLESNTQTQS